MLDNWKLGIKRHFIYLNKVEEIPAKMNNAPLLSINSYIMSTTSEPLVVLGNFAKASTAIETCFLSFLGIHNYTSDF